ncbi:hypothetical protein ACIP1G_08640 [Pseudomonas sp. NPDC089392]|uniref:hypothetical protein n=1 Tax=Pseudomonas sp. NPDC089392 TaxID=3364459 RepID=UPI0038145A69
MDYLAIEGCACRDQVLNDLFWAGMNQANIELAARRHRYAGERQKNAIFVADFFAVNRRCVTFQNLLVAPRKCQIAPRIITISYIFSQRYSDGDLTEKQN